MATDFSAARALSASKAFLFLLLLFCSSCVKRGEQWQEDKKLDLVNRDGILLDNGKPFSGLLYSTGANGDTLFTGGYVEGREQGEHKTWYSRQRLKESRFYQAGKKTGTHTGYWENGNLKFEYRYRNDLHEGVQREWFRDGKPFSCRNYLEGHEYGLQQTWDQQGKLATSYEAKNGRNYGNIGRKHCASVWKNDSFSVAPKPRGSL